MHIFGAVSGAILAVFLLAFMEEYPFVFWGAVVALVAAGVYWASH